MLTSWWGLVILVAPQIVVASVSIVAVCLWPPQEAGE
jgi:hypothetical protein